MADYEIIPYLRLFIDSIIESLLPYAVIVVILIIVASLSLKIIRGEFYFSLLCFWGYVSIIIKSTIVDRDISDKTGFSFVPFWSYIEIYKGVHSLIVEDIMNILVFIPFGFFGGLAFKKISFLKLLTIGFFVSSMIEMIQLIFGLGFAEIDDVVHNTLGVAIGYGLSKLVVTKTGYSAQLN